MDASKIVKRVSGIHDSIADAMGNPNQVWCKTCGGEADVDAADCLRHGWPECCGHTMTLAHPSTWSNS